MRWIVHLVCRTREREPIDAQTRRAVLTDFVLSFHGQFEEEFLRIVADQNVFTVGFTRRKLFEIRGTIETVQHIDAAEQHRRRIVSGKIVVAPV